MLIETIIAWTTWAAPLVAADLETARQARAGHPEIIASPRAMPRPSDAWVRAVSSSITTRPLPMPPRREAIHWLVWAFHESAFRDDVRSSDGLDSVCTMQVRVFAWSPWSAEELVRDPAKCVTIAREAMARSWKCDPLFPMACYAAGEARSGRNAGRQIDRARDAETERNFIGLSARPDAP